MLGPERPLGAGGGDWGRPQQISLRPLRRPPRIVPVGVRQVGDSTELRPWWVSGPRMGLASRCVAGLLYSPKVPPRVNLRCRRCHCPRRWAPRYCYRVLWGGETAPAPGSVSPCIPTSARPGLLHPVAGLVLEKVSTRRSQKTKIMASGPITSWEIDGETVDNPWVGKIPWRRKWQPIPWQPTPVFLPGESQGRGSLVGCRLWGCTESDTTEAT